MDVDGEIIDVKPETTPELLCTTARFLAGLFSLLAKNFLAENYIDTKMKMYIRNLTSHIKNG